MNVTADVSTYGMFRRLVVCHLSIAFSFISTARRQTAGIGSGGGSVFGTRGALSPRAPAAASRDDEDDEDEDEKAKVRTLTEANRLYLFISLPRCMCPSRSCFRFSVLFSV